MPKAKVILPSRKKLNQKNRASNQPLMLLPDFGTPERWQHGTRTLHVDKESGDVAARALEECMLDALCVAGRITPALYTAGMKLRRAYMRAAIASRQGSKYAPGTGEKVQYREFTRSASEEDAYQEWRAALLAAGVQHSALLVDVCCIGMAPRREMMEKLCDGLQALYAHYRLSALAAL